MATAGEKANKKDENMVDQGMDGHARSRRKALKVAVGALCTEAGFGYAHESVLETLTEMLQSLLTEIGRSSKAYTELCGRTEVMVTDVLMALIDQGINIEGIPAHAHRSNKSVFIPPGQSAPQVTQRVLAVGEKHDRPGHIPDYLPSFPDPHSYIRTQTHKQPVTEYQLIREKAASQKRDVERALTRFVAKTGLTQSLFKDDASSFPLIAVSCHPQPYLNALLPKDQDLETQDLSEHHEKSPVIRKVKASSSSEAGGLLGIADDSTQNKTDAADADGIDNPYLLPVKPPKYKKRKV